MNKQTFFYAGIEDPQRCLDLYLPDQPPKALMIHFHGGCLTRGSRHHAAERFSTLIDHGFALISVEYRLVPSVQFPAFLEDAAQAVAFVQQHLADWGCPPHLFLEGSSAGAYIVMMLHLDPQYYAAAGVDGNAIAGYLSDSAQMFAHFTVLKERGMDDRLEVIDETAPISYIREGLYLKPLLILYYTADMACRPEENRLFYASVRRVMPKAPVEIRQIEGKHTNPDDPEAFADLYERFMNRILKRMESI